MLRRDPSRRIDSADKLHEWFAALGLARITVRQVRFVQPLHADDAWSFYLSAAMRGFVEGLPPDAVERVRTRFLDGLRAAGIDALDASSSSPSAIDPDRNTMRAEHSCDDRPFTAVVCHGPVCGRLNGQAVVEGLRDSIRRKRHAVLMSAGCLLGRLGCYASAVADAGRSNGVVLVVQDRTTERAPRHRAIWVGPIVDDDDVTAVRRWLDDGRPRAGHLPERLHFQPAPRWRAASN